MTAALVRGPSEPMLELNMTPLIDVLLVLIIMFIITIPIQSHAVKLDLPVGIALPTNDQRNLLTIAPDGVARWNGTATNDATLMATLRASQAMQPQPELHLRPDAQARYERVDEVLAMTTKPLANSDVAELEKDRRSIAALFVACRTPVPDLEQQFSLFVNHSATYWNSARIFLRAEILGL